MRLLWRSRQDPGYREGWPQRLGFVEFQTESQPLWIHAVSVGEVRAAIPLINALQKHYPGLPILVTTTTPTGAAIVKQQLKGLVTHSYLPFDLPTGIQRFLKRVNPVAVLIMETELWPNLVRALRKRQVPCVLVNGRLSERAYRRYRWLRQVMASVLQDFDFIAAQTDDDAKRFVGLGADPQRVQALGNLKFDIDVPASVQQLATELKVLLGAERKVWVAASTHPGEEEIMLRVQTTLRQHDARSLLVLVPRHPERCSEVSELCRQHGLQAVRRTDARACTPTTDVFLVDSMGELLAFYAATDVAVVGGSFVSVGGHNPLEPASLDRPIITGPHKFNFAAVYSQMEQAEAVISVNDEQELLEGLKRLLIDRTAVTRLTANAANVLNKERGAVQRLLRLIAERLPDKGQDKRSQLLRNGQVSA